MEIFSGFLLSFPNHNLRSYVFCRLVVFRFQIIDSTKNLGLIDSTKTNCSISFHSTFVDYCLLANDYYSRIFFVFLNPLLLPNKCKSRIKQRIHGIIDVATSVRFSSVFHEIIYRRVNAVIDKQLRTYNNHIEVERINSVPIGHSNRSSHTNRKLKGRNSTDSASNPVVERL